MLAALDMALSFEHEVLFRLSRTEDAADGIGGFVEKRDAHFKGE
jgi:hypothetical protein